MNKFKKFDEEFKGLNKAQALKAIELIFNESGVKEMLYYYTADSCRSVDELSGISQKEVAKYTKVLKLAKKLTAIIY